MPDPTPKRKLPREIDVKSLARSYTKIAVETLGGIAGQGVSESARVAASIALLDRGWNKPASSVEHTGKDGAEDIRVVIRTIIEGKKP